MPASGSPAVPVILEKQSRQAARLDASPARCASRHVLPRRSVLMIKALALTMQDAWHMAPIARRPALRNVPARSSGCSIQETERRNRLKRPLDYHLKNTI